MSHQLVLGVSVYVLVAIVLEVTIHIPQVADLQQECQQVVHDVRVVLESQESQDSKRSQ